MEGGGPEKGLKRPLPQRTPFFPRPHALTAGDPPSGALCPPIDVKPPAGAPPCPPGVQRPHRGHQLCPLPQVRQPRGQLQRGRDLQDLGPEGRPVQDPPGAQSGGGGHRVQLRRVAGGQRQRGRHGAHLGHGHRGLHCHHDRPHGRSGAAVGGAGRGTRCALPDLPPPLPPPFLVVLGLFFFLPALSAARCCLCRACDVVSAARAMLSLPRSVVSAARCCLCHAVLSLPRGVVSATRCCLCHAVLSLPRGVVSTTRC